MFLRVIGLNFRHARKTLPPATLRNHLLVSLCNPVKYSSRIAKVMAVFGGRAESDSLSQLFIYELCDQVTKLLNLNSSFLFCEIQAASQVVVLNNT